jgi:hypothetical protein
MADATPDMKNLEIAQDKIADMLRNLEGGPPGAAVGTPKVKSKIMDILKGGGLGLGDLGTSTTKLLNKFGIETPLQKEKKKKKKRENDPKNTEIISAKSGKLIKCGAQIKGTSPLIRKRK